MAAKLVQIIYKHEQKASCYPFAEIYFNDTLTVFFENEVIKNVVQSSEADKIAVCSWKLKSKMRYYIGRPRDLTIEVLETDYDVMSFTKNSTSHQMFAAAAAWHPGFMVIFDKILSAIGVTRPHEVKIPIYQNHFSCKRAIYQEYVNTYLIPAMEVIKNDASINALAMANSKYSDLTNQSAAHLQEKLGISFYPLVPFLLERLFSVFVHNKKINVTYL